MDGGVGSKSWEFAIVGRVFAIGVQQTLGKEARSISMKM